MSTADFLVITALDEETEAVKKRLHGVVPITGTRFFQGTVTSQERNDYCVVCGQCDESGNSFSSQRTTEGIKDYQPCFVLLVGITAGFPEKSVALGDVLVPQWVLYYEKTKETPKGPEYRSHPRPITAAKLAYIGEQIAKNEKGSWYVDIEEPRPSNDERSYPSIITEGMIGSGEKIIASELSTIRSYLVEKCAIGLEMEAYGVATACYPEHITFLVVKGVQDDATTKKDAEGEKDRWRLYAADAASALAIRIIQYTPRNLMKKSIASAVTSSVEDYESRIRELLEEYEENRPVPPFEFTVSVADTYHDLRARRCTSQNLPPESLLPSEARRAVILHGGGGTGKTRIMHVLARRLLEQERCPVLIDLKLWSARGSAEQAEAEKIEDILRHCAIPRFQPNFLQELTQNQREFVIMVDGLNEVPRPVRDELLRYLRSMFSESTRSYLLVADRYGASDDPGGFIHAGVEPLSEDFVRQVFDEKFAPGVTFEGLEPSVKDILRIPFFLDLKIRKAAELELAETKSDMLEAFFLKQLRLQEADLDKIAEATITICKEYRSQTFDASTFNEKVREDLYRLLHGASVLNEEGTGFDHHLWRDYLCARYLAKNEDKWVDYSFFDAATFTSESLEPLTMVVEQLQGKKIIDEFLRRVYDWNFYAAIDCVREVGRSPKALVSDSIRFVLLAAIGEKRFDRVISTAERARSRLQEHDYAEGIPFSQVASFSELLDHVRSLEGDEPWFNSWKDLFARGEDQRMTEEEINVLTSADPIFGWTMSNVARRSRLSQVGQRQLRTVYFTSASDPQAGSIRWRAVHVLGAYPSRRNVSVLVSALQEDSYHWVKYGAARALIEIAASADQKLRKDVLRELGDAIGQVWSQDIRSGRLISKEIGKTVFIKGAGTMWKENVRPLLHRLQDLEVEASAREDWTQLIDRFDAEELP